MYMNPRPAAARSLLCSLRDFAFIVGHGCRAIILWYAAELPSIRGTRLRMNTATSRPHTRPFSASKPLSSFHHHPTKLPSDSTNALLRPPIDSASQAGYAFKGGCSHQAAILLCFFLLGVRVCARGPPYTLLFNTLLGGWQAAGAYTPSRYDDNELACKAAWLKPMLRADGRFHPKSLAV